MNGLPITIRRALGRACRLPTRPARTGRWSLAALMIAATVLTTTLVPPATARAEAPVDSAIRLQVLLKKVHIINDRDWGEGEMTLSVSFHEGDGPITRETPVIASMSRAVKADSGEDVILERDFPWEGDVMGSGVTRHAGMPLLAGHKYLLQAGMLEHDGVFSAEDDLGWVTFRLSEANGWGIGVHTIRSTWSDGSPAYFELTFEIRPAFLPDLRPAAIKVLDLPGTTRELLCATVLNTGSANPGPFEVTFRVDGNVPPGGKASAGQLVSGTSGDLCTETDVPDTGQHRLSAYVDEARTVIEVSELNNVHDQLYTAALQPASTPAQADPTSAPTEATSRQPGSAPAGQADLSVSAIKVNGRVPDGKNDCKDGKNALAVIVKNAGAAAADAFAVQLAVDGDESVEETVDGLEAGQEREVRFGDVKLKKGERQFDATVDAKNTVAEAGEDNNERSVTATCRDN